MISVFHFPLYLPLASLQPSTSRSLYRNRSFLRIPLAARPRFSSLRSLRFVPSHSDTNKDMPPPFPQPSPQSMLSTCNSWIEKKEDQKGLWGLCGLYGMQKEVFIYLFILYFFFNPPQELCNSETDGCLHAAVWFVPEDTELLIRYTFNFKGLVLFMCPAHISLHVRKPFESSRVHVASVLYDNTIVTMHVCTAGF